jgi:hypothetical protein
MGEQSNGGSLIERFVGVGKDMVVLLRDAALLVLAGLLLFFPANFNDLLVSAGFEEGSIVGFKWKAKLVQADDALKEAQATIGNLKAQLEKTTKALGEGLARSDDQALKSSFSKLEEESRQLNAASAQVAASVRSTIASNAPLVEKAQSAVSANGGWGVVLGSDVSLEAARDEIMRASQKRIPTAGVYFRNGYYASIAVVDNRATAQEYLAIAKSFRPDAYVASMATWCRNPQQRDGFVECQTRP